MTAAAQALLAEIRRAVTRRWVLMEVCGGQTHSILRYGLDALLPGAVELVHGPGCPVCVTPLEMIDRAHAIAERPGVIFTSFGEMLRVPGSRSSLLDARSRGADVRVVYSPLDALRIARENPDRPVVFFAVGFETTAPANAMAVARAQADGVKNFSVLVSHVLVPPAMAAILADPGNRVDAYLGPGHVAAVVVGCDEYEALAARFRVPIVITGFEPVDILEGVLLAVRQLEEGRAEVENQYARAVRRGGNPGAQRLVDEVFAVCDRRWRGVGTIPRAASRSAPRTAITTPSASSTRPASSPRSRPCASAASSSRARSAPTTARPSASSAPRAPPRRDDGLLRGRLRRLFRLPPPRARAGSPR